MKLITAPEIYTPKEGEYAVFLAGGITGCHDWQSRVINYLKDFHHTDNLVIFNPRRDNFPIDDPNAVEEQIKWEFDHIEKSDLFTMYFCNSESDQPICMYELGRNLVRWQERFPEDYHMRIIISIETGYKRTKDVEIQSKLACGIRGIYHQWKVPELDQKEFPEYHGYQIMLRHDLMFGENVIDMIDLD